MSFCLIIQNMASYQKRNCMSSECAGRKGQEVSNIKKGLVIKHNKRRKVTNHGLGYLAVRSRRKGAVCRIF